jgi:hypothetical protein
MFKVEPKIYQQNALTEKKIDEILLGFKKHNK